MTDITDNELKEPAPRYNYISPDEYLAMERKADTRHEYYEGHVKAMSGASLKHNQIRGNLSAEIGTFLKGRNCRILTADMRVSTPNRGAYVYPDASITCGEPQLEDETFDTLLNPLVIFEILSPSTSKIDAGYKFLFYQQIPSLQEYIMIDSLQRFVCISRKQPDGSWKEEEIADGIAIKHIHISAINFTVRLDDLYYLTGL